MKWHAQVIHVARKDLRRLGWFVLAYAAVVAGATVAVVEWGAFGAAGPGLWMFLVVLLGMLFSALLVQADSPSRGNAFWVTLPLYPGAVFAAKLLLALVLLLALPLLGQLAGLAAHDVAAADLPGLLARSAAAYGIWLGTAAVIAALTPDLRTFIVVLALIKVGEVLLGTAAATVLWGTVEAPGAPPILTSVAIVTGALLVLVHQYTTRDVRQGIVVAALLLAVSLLLPFAAPRAEAPARPAAGEVPDPLRAVVLGIEEIRPQPGFRTEFVIRMEGAPEFHQYVLVSPVVHVHMPDGSSTAVDTPESWIWLNRPVLRLDEDLRWLGAREAPHRISRAVSLDLTRAHQEALVRGEARLSVQGHMEVREPRVRAALPVAAGAAVARDGQRARIARAESTPEGPHLEVHMSQVISRRSPEELHLARRSWHHSAPFALVNRERREAIEMMEGGGSGSDLGLVLPGPRTQTSHTQLVPQHRGGAATPVPEGWLDGADLLFIDWVPVGSYPVRIEGGNPEAGRTSR